MAIFNSYVSLPEAEFHQWSFHVLSTNVYVDSVAPWPRAPVFARKAMILASLETAHPCCHVSACLSPKVEKKKSEGKKYIPVV